MISSCLLASSSLAAPNSIAIQLINAAEGGQSQIIESLLGQGVFIDERGQFGTTALMRASMKGRKDIVELLIKNGANVDAQDSGGATALHIASREGKAEIVKILLAAKAIVDTKDGENWTPLMRAASRGRLEVVNVLLNAGADPNIKNDWSETALVYAMKSGKTEVAEAILAKGASKDIADIEGRNFQQIAASKGMDLKESNTQLASNGTGGGNALALSTSLGKNSSGNIVLAQLDGGDLSKLSPASGGIVTGNGSASSSAGRGGYIVQFSHFKEDDASRAINKANEIWNTFAKKSPGAMNGVKPVLSKTRLPEENTVLFQVRGGYFPTETAAKDFCSKLNLSNSECLIIPQSDEASSSLASAGSGSAPITTQKNAMVITGPVLSSISAPVETVTMKEINPGIVKQKQEAEAPPMVVHQTPSKIEIPESLKSSSQFENNQGYSSAKSEPAALPAPAAAAKPEPIVTAKAEPAPLPAPEPIVAAKTEPAILPTPVAAAKPEPIVTAKAEPAPLPAPEPIVATKPEPEKPAEFVITATDDPAPITKPEPVVTAKAEPAPLPAPEPIAATKPEPEKPAEFVITATDDPAPITKPEPVVTAPKPEIEKVVEKKAEATPEPITQHALESAKIEPEPEKASPQIMAMQAPSDDATSLASLAPATATPAKQYRYIKRVTRTKSGKKIVRYRKVMVASNKQSKRRAKMNSKTSESITAKLNRQQIEANSYDTAHSEALPKSPAKEIIAANELAPNPSKEFFTAKEAEKLLESPAPASVSTPEPDAKAAPIVVYPQSAANNSSRSKRESRRSSKKSDKTQISTAEFLDYETQTAAPVETVNETAREVTPDSTDSARKLSHSEKMKERRRERNIKRDQRRKEQAAAAQKARQLARMQRQQRANPDALKDQELASAKPSEAQKPEDILDAQTPEPIESETRKKIAKPKIKISKKSQSEINNSRRKPNSQTPAEDDIIAARKSLEVAKDIDSSKIAIPVSKATEAVKTPEEPIKSAIEAAVKAPEITDTVNVKKVEVKEAVRVPLSGNNFGGSETFKLSSPKISSAGAQPIIPILQQLPATDPNLISVQISYFDSQAVIQAFAASIKQNVTAISNKSFVILTGQNQDNGPLVLAITGLTSTNESSQVCEFVKKQGYICNATQNTAQSTAQKEAINLDTADKPNKTRVYTLLGGYKSAYDANNAWSELLASGGTGAKDTNHMVTKKSAGINTVFQLKAGPFESPQKAKSFCEKIGDSADLCEVEE